MAMRLNAFNAEEVLDQMAPFIHFEIDGDRLGATRVLRDDDLGAAPIEVGDDVVAVKGPDVLPFASQRTADHRRQVRFRQTPPRLN